MSHHLILGITGGIATGKTTFARHLAALVPCEVFDSDQCAKELLEMDRTVQCQVLETFGNEVFAADGSVDRSRLREIVFADEEKRHALERILHPMIRSRWTALVEKMRGENGWLIIDIPLLFETGAERFFDKTIVVACGHATQQQRLLYNRNLNGALAGKMIAAQMDLGIKIGNADHVVWNDGSPGALEDQAALLANFLKI